MRKVVPYIFMILGLTLALGHAQFRGTDRLSNLADFTRLGETLTAAHLEAKQATVCVDLGGGSSGSGVIVSADGLVLSAAHVTQEVGKELTAVLEDGREFPMVGLGLDTTTDASFAQITLPDGAERLPFVTLSEEMSLGEYVFSLGHSGGFDLERGSVIRLGRILELDATSLRTDCTLIGGDSGGPLFNLAGELIGIHSRVGTVTNSNTHVPVKVFTDQWEELIEGALKGDGTFADAGIPFIGMHLLARDGVLHVTNVLENSRAQKIGVLEGDHLLAVGEEEVSSGMGLLEALKKLPLVEEGMKVSLTFLRGTEKITVDFTFNE